MGPFGPGVSEAGQGRAPLHRGSGLGTAGVRVQSCTVTRAAKPSGSFAMAMARASSFCVRFFGRPKCLDQDAAGRKMHAGGKGIELLVDDGRGGFDQHAGLLGVGMQLVENGAEALPALLFENSGLARCQMPQVSNHVFFCRQAVLAERAANERLEDLLSPPPASAEHELERGTVDERLGKIFELLDDLIEAVVPEGFVRQKASAKNT